MSIDFILIVQIYLALGLSYWVMAIPISNWGEWVMEHKKDLFPSLVADIVTLAEVAVAWPYFMLGDLKASRRSKK